MTTDNQTTKEAIEAFHNLSNEDTAKLKGLNTRIQNHKGKWATRVGGDKNPNGSINLPWTQNGPLIEEFTDFMYGRDLLLPFSWNGADKVSRLFASEDPTKYDDIDLETALKLIFIASRKERHAGGAFAWAFESGNFPKLVNRLVELKEA